MTEANKDDATRLMLCKQIVLQYMVGGRPIQPEPIGGVPTPYELQIVDDLVAAIRAESAVSAPQLAHVVFPGDGMWLDWRPVEELTDAELKRQSQDTFTFVSGRSPTGTLAMEEHSKVLGRGFAIDAEVRKRVKAAVSAPQLACKHCGLWPWADGPGGPDDEPIETHDAGWVAAGGHAFEAAVSSPAALLESDPDIPDVGAANAARTHEPFRDDSSYFFDRTDRIHGQAEAGSAAWDALKAEYDREGAILTWDKFSWQAGYIRALQEVYAGATEPRDITEGARGLVRAQPDAVKVPTAALSQGESES